MSELRKIAHLHTRYRDAGGEDAVVERERRDLRRRGFDVIDLDFQNAFEPRPAAAGLLQSPWNMASRSTVTAALEREHPDVLHVHNTWFTASPSTFARRELPVISTIHNYRFTCLNAYLFRDGSTCTDCIDGSFSSGIQHRCYRGSRVASVALAASTKIHRVSNTLERSVDRTIVLSEFAADLFHRTTGYPSDKIICMDNAVPDPGPRLNHPADSDLVIAVGRITVEKGFRQLIDAWRLIAPKHLRLAIVGEGPDREALAHDLPPGVTFVGRKSSGEIQAMMLGARAVVIPSQWFEGQPLVLIEALAAGLPAITTPQPPIAEVVTRSGQVTSASPSPEALAQAMDVLSDSQALAEMSVTGRAAFLRSHTEEVVGDQLVTVYGGVLRE